MQSNLHGDQPAAVADDVLSDRKELAATAFQRTRMPMVVTDATQPDYPIVLANEAFLKLTKYDANEVLGKNCRFLQGAATSAAAVAEIRSGLQEEREVNVEILNYRKDGSAFWNQLHLSPIYDDGGRLIYHFGSQVDRTDFRRVLALEASEHRLLLEVDHRANNVLAIVDSIVRLTKAEDANLYAASVQKRVQSLARAHGILAQRNWHEIPLREVIRSKIEPYGAKRAILEGPEIMLMPMPFSRSHCTFTNWRSTRRLMVHLRARWGRCPLAGKRAPRMGLVLVWEESGGPRPPSTRRSGFGTVIADATIRRQLHGSAERELLETGARIVVQVPDVTVAK